jgi:hypothetical protein
MRPILLPLFSVNHIAPSGPPVMAPGAARTVGIENLRSALRIVMRSIVLVISSLNYIAPSGPAAMPE